MSHFSVIVIGPDIDAQLQPYHEFECTGTNDQHVIDVDVTDEVRSDYATDTRTVYSMPTGERVDSSDPRLFREATAAERADAGPMGLMGSGFGGGKRPHESRDWGDGKGYRAKIFHPAAVGAEEIVVPVRDSMTMLEFVEYCRGEQAVVGPGQAPDTDNGAKFGYVRVDADGEVVAVIDRTNPNKHWDYHRIGGRWSGFFPIKPTGAAGYLVPGKHWDGPKNVKAGTADQCTVSQLDIDRARREAADEAAARFDKWDALVKEHGQARSWADVRAQFTDIDEAREVYQSQPLIMAARATKDYGWDPPVDELGYDRAAYIRTCENRTLVPYAVVKDGKWIAKGTMGWFGCSHDECDMDKWNEDFHRMLADLPPDTMLTIVDCHI
jgi:hypothetical protein